MRLGRHAILSRKLRAASKPAMSFTWVMIFQHLSIGITVCHTILIPNQAAPWKHTEFLSFHSPQHKAEEKTLTIPFFLLHNQYLAMDS
jgi:hypothetical protein